jgi:AcrR family transcriptional regulator
MSSGKGRKSEKSLDSVQAGRMMKKTGVPERGSLTRERVLRAALAIADKSGIESLSMRLLGRRLGVEAMSLYNHVANKDEILDGILELFVEEIAIPPVGADWRSAMKERAISARRAFNRHPWASALMDSRVSSGPSRLRYFDRMLGTLHGAGFSLELAARAFSVLDCYIYGFARQHLNVAYSDEKQAGKRAEALRDALPDDVYPYLAQMAELTMKNGYDEEADFEFGLNLILDGLERSLISASG